MNAAELVAPNLKLTHLLKAARELVSELEAMSKKLPMQQIVKITCEVRGCEAELLYDGRRTQFASETRFIIFWVARKHTRLGLVEIGEHFGMDHGSVMHGINRADELLAIDRKFAADLMRVDKDYASKIS